MKTHCFYRRRLMAASAVLVLITASCRRGTSDVSWHGDERLRVELEQHAKLLEYRFESRGGKLAGELDAIRARIAGDRETLRIHKAELARLEGEIASIMDETGRLADEAAREARQQALGRKFDVLTTTSGRSYRGVVVRKITAGSVTIRHESGTARLRPADLEAEQQRIFGICPQAAALEKQIEEENSLAYERQLAALANLDRQLEVPGRTAAAATRPTPRGLALASSRERYRARPLAQPARTFGTGSLYRSSRTTYRTYRTRYYYVYPDCVRAHRTPRSPLIAIGPYAPKQPPIAPR